MYDSVGGKIKGYVVVMTTIGIVASVIGGLCLLGESVGIALLIMTVGSLVSWISGLAFYGFGQAIENSESLCELVEMRKTLHAMNATLKLMQNQNRTVNAVPGNTVLITNPEPVTGSVYEKPLENSTENGGEGTVPAFIFPSRGETVCCPRCGNVQSGRRNNCWECNATFVYENEF